MSLAHSMEDKNILVVEDDPVLAKFWNRLLSDFPCKHFEVFNSPVEAMNWFKLCPADILITDISMPDIDGIQLAHDILARKPETKIVITSGYIQDKTQFEGFDDFVHIIKKPYQDINNIRDFLTAFIQNDEEVMSVEKNEKQNELRVHIWDL